MNRPLFTPRHVTSELVPRKAWRALASLPLDGSLRSSLDSYFYYLFYYDN
jgi:hypothetical protein